MKLRNIRAVKACLVSSVILILATAAGADSRLDTRVRPTSEYVTLNLDANKTAYSGTVLIDIVVESEVDAFTFHAFEMSLDRVELRDQKGPIGVEVDEIEENGLRELKAERKLKRGKYQLEIDFSKDFNTQAVGLYRMEDAGKGYIFTQFESIDARRAFPCWDEPSYKITYQMRITVPMIHEVVTNTPVEKVIMGAADKTLVFKKTKPMPSYLLAIATGPLESVAIKDLSVPGRIYTVKGQKELALYATEVTAEILKGLEVYFGRPYPYEKLDVIAIPEYWPGAMENPGAVTFADRLLLFDAEGASASNKRSVCRIMAHELAHMWFGDLVTMLWWDDLWLNESFADWLGDKITEQLFPEFEQSMSGLAEAQQALTSDAMPSTKQIHHPVNNPADIMEDLGLAYSKGKALLRMVEMWIGEDVFQEGVRNYINSFAWGNSVAADLFSALSTAAGADLSPILSSFLDQSGYPLIIADVDRGVIKLSQRRFLNAGVEADTRLWTVPVRLKYSDGNQVHRRSVLLEGESAQIEVGTDVEWILPDEDATGYYRWITPPDLLFKLTENPSETLSKRERAAFLGNARALLSAGALAGDDYLSLLSTFASDHDASTISQVITDLGSVRVAFITDEIKPAFAHYVRETLGPTLDRIGLEPRAGEDESVNILRPTLISWLGNIGGDEGVRAYCKDISAKYRNDSGSVDGSLAGIALRISAIDGDMDLYEDFRGRFVEAKNPSERSRYLSAMSAFTDPSIQDAVLAFALSGEVRPTEYFRAIDGISETVEGRKKVWMWMTTNYEKITSRIPPEFAAYMPYFASGCSQERLAVAQAFFSMPEHTVDGTGANMAKVAEQVTDCTNLREREGAAVEDYLHKLAAR